MVHKLKLETKYFQDWETGLKTFEVRCNDRNFLIGDDIILEETFRGIYTGRKMLPKRITYIFEGGQYGLAVNYCILGFNIIKRKGK